MNEHPMASGGVETHTLDVAIIGAGISGIDAGYRIQTSLPDYSYAILEGRASLGGTWSLFKYPGVRSDSALQVFGFPFHPWQSPNSIATGDSILDYMKETAEKFGIDRHIRFGHRVLSADWSSDAQRWRLEVDDAGRRKVFHAKFVIMGTGYYDYEKPLDAKIPGLEDFKGQTVHPQFWPEDLDFKGKKMVIVGSGATAITILPAVVDQGVGHVTLLQRSPGYVLSVPQKKPGERRWYEYLLPRALALRLVRFQFIVGEIFLYHFCRRFPARARRFLVKGVQSALPKGFVTDPHFEPRYSPWDERLCFCPDADYFRSFSSGRARIATDTISRVTATGIELASGDTLDADIIVTATGLNIQFCGKIALSVDGEPVSVPDRFLWRSTMLTGVPNLGLVVGYTNASWTLGADVTARLLVRLMAHMRDHGLSSATPQISPEDARHPALPLDLRSTYIQKGSAKMPRAGRSAPWLARRNYIADLWDATRADLGTGLAFERVST